MGAFNPTVYGVFEAVSVRGKPKRENPDPDSTRSLNLMMQPGTEDDPYGGWKQADSIHGVEEVVGPDGREVPIDEIPAYGYEDDKLYRVEYEDGVATITVA